MPDSRSKTLSLLDQMLINEDDRSKKLLISPSDAKEILQHYHIKSNRSISPTQVTRLVKCIKQGKWGMSDSLKFNINGELFDGQHRLSAVIAAGCSLVFIQGGYSLEEMANIDRHKSRNLVDVARINGQEWCTQDITTTFNNLFHSLNSKKIQKMSDSQRLDCMDQLKEGLEFASLYKNANGRKVSCAAFRAVVARAYYADKRIPKGLLNNAMAYVHGYNPVSNPEFFDQNHLEHPPTILRRLREFYIAKEVTKHTHDTGRGAFAVKYFMVQYALNKFIKKENRSKLILRFDDGNLFPSKLIDSMLDF